MARPIVIELSNRGRTGRRRAPRLKDADLAERNLYRAVRRSAGAIDAGTRRYQKSRRTSARRERDGAFIDLVPNMAKGVAVTAGKIGPVPLDLLRATPPNSIRRMARRSVRLASRAIDRS
jgi:hypothetical protein